LIYGYTVLDQIRPAERASTSAAVLSILPPAAGVFTIAVGFLVLAGWLFDIDLLKRPVPGFVAMNPLTASLFIFAGFSVLLSLRSDRWKPVGPDLLMKLKSPPASLADKSAKLIAAIVLGLALTKLVGLLSGWHWNVDEFLFRSKLWREHGMPNRMAPNTAANFVFVGLALLTLDVSVKRISPSQAFAILAVFGSLLPITGYVYGVQSFRGLASFIPMALHTALVFVALAIGVLFARTDAPLTKLFASSDPRGVMARRLFPLAILLTLFFGWMCVWGERNQLYESTFGVALLAITLSILFVILVRWTVWTVGKIEMERATADRALRESRLQLQESLRQMELILQHTREIICTIDEAARFVSMSAASRNILGFAERDVIGRSFQDLHAAADRPKIEAAFRDLRNGGGVSSFFARCRCHDGTFADIVWSLQRSQQFGKTFCVGRKRDD
jgi:PAS domain S-box-containing protein